MLLCCSSQNGTIIKTISTLVCPQGGLCRSAHPPALCSDVLYAQPQQMPRHNTSTTHRAYSLLLDLQGLCAAADHTPCHTRILSTTQTQSSAFSHQNHTHTRALLQQTSPAEHTQLHHAHPDTKHTPTPTPTHSHPTSRQSPVQADAARTATDAVKKYFAEQTQSTPCQPAATAPADPLHRWLRA